MSKLNRRLLSNLCELVEQSVNDMEFPLSKNKTVNFNMKIRKIFNINLVESERLLLTKNNNILSMWQYIKSLMILIIYETRAHIQFKSNTSLNEIFCTGGELFERSINGSCPSLYNPQTASAETLLKEAKTQRTNHFSIICPDRSSMRLLLKIAACYFLLVI